MAMCVICLDIQYIPADCFVPVGTVGLSSAQAHAGSTGQLILNYFLLMDYGYGCYLQIIATVNGAVAQKSDVCSLCILMLPLLDDRSLYWLLKK